MSYAPATILAARDYVHQRTGLPLDALGIVGDAAHGNEGYHCGWDRLQFGKGWNDYSVSQSPRDGNPSNAASAFDVGSWDGLQAFSNWLVAECRAGAPDTQDIREVIYSPDGNTVRRWDRLGTQPGGDDSHLFHTHISYFRDSEFNDKTALFRRYFEGDDEMSEKAEIQVNLVASNWNPNRAEWVAGHGDAAAWDRVTGGNPNLRINGVKPALDNLAVAVAQIKAKVDGITAPPAAPTIDYVKLAAELIKQLKA